MPLDEERARHVPAETRREQGLGEHGLDEQALGARRREVVEHLFEREAVLEPEREHDRLVVRGRLQLEAEPATEPLAEREAERAVDAAAEGRVDHELHPAALVEEALEHDAPLGGHGAEDAGAALDVLDDRARGLRFVRLRGERLRGQRLLAHAGHLERELPRAPGALPEPERDRGRSPSSVCDADHARADAQDPPRRGAELKDVPGVRFDREILVQRADRGALGLEHDLIVGRVRDRAAARDRDEPRPARRVHDALHAVFVEQGPTPPRVRPNHRVEVLARELAVGVSAATQREQRVLRPRGARALGDELLGEDVERRARLRRAIEHAAAHRAHDRVRLDQLVLGEREEASLRQPRDAVPRAPDPLEERRDRAGGAHLDHELDVPDVDAELERRRGDEHGELAALEAPLCFASERGRETAVVATHALAAEPGTEPGRDALGELAGVHEHERRPVRAHELGDPLVDLVPHLVRAHGRERRWGELDAEIDGAQVSRVHRFDRAPHPGEETRDVLDRLLRRGEANPKERTARPSQRLEALEREREVGPAFVAAKLVDLVHDHRAHGAEHAAPPVAGEQDVERLGRRHQDVRRPLPHRRAHLRLGIAGAHEDPDVGQARIERPDLRERQLEVLLDVRRERAERGDVHDARFVRQPRALGEELVERAQKGGECLARAGRRRDQRVSPGAEVRPPLALRTRGLPQVLLEPATHRGVKGSERHRESIKGPALDASGRAERA